MDSPLTPVAVLRTFPVSQVQFRERSTAQVSLSFKLLLVFLILLYSNLPLLFPALDALRPAQLVALSTLAALLIETALTRRNLDFAFPEGGLVLAFLGAAALSSLTALWLRQAAEAVSDLVKIVLVFFFIVNTVTSERRLRTVMWTMVLGGLFPAAGAIRNYLNGQVVEGRAGWVGIFANPNELAYSLVILVPMALSLAAGSHFLLRLLLLGISAVCVAAIFVTFSRGGLIGLGAVMALYAWRKRSLWLGFALLMLAAGGLVVASQHWTRTESFTDLKTDLSFRQRLETSLAGLAMFADHPLLGVGVGCSVIAWPLYAPEDLYSRHALANHNTFIQPLSETGILGFIPFALLVAIGLARARRLALRSPPDGLANLGAALELALWGFVMCGMTGAYALSWFPYILFGLVASAKRIAERT